MQCTGVGEHPVLTWTITRANPVIAVVMPANAMTIADSLINKIRQRPAMYLGSKSLTAFYHFLGGYQMACSLHSIDDGLGLNIPQLFHDWVAYRTHFRESTSGWCSMIVSTTESEETAFDRFFELLEEHSRRIPRLVAEFLNPISNTRTTRNGEDFLIPPPKRVQLVKFTDDPGFFALHESEDWPDRFHPYLSWRHGPNGGQLVVHDEKSYSEMIREDEQWAREVDQLIDIEMVDSNAEEKA